MIDKHITVDEIHWRRVLPWLNLLRAAPLAIRCGQVLLAMLAVLAMEAGYWVLFNHPIGAPSYNGERLGHPANILWAIESGMNYVEYTESGSSSITDLLSVNLLIREVWPWATVTSAAADCFDVRGSWPSLAAVCSNLLWSLLVWAIFGGAITRIVAVRFARDESVPMLTALKFSSRNWQSYLYGPLLPMLGVIPFAVLGARTGAINRWWHVEFGVIPFCLNVILMACGIGMAFFLLLMALSWPLMVAAISTEGSDGFDGLSRAFGYVMNRPWYFAFLVGMTHFVGIVLLAVARLFAVFAMHLAQWSSGIFGLADLQFIAHHLVFAVMVCYFWSATTIAYFLLRQSEDGTPLNQVYIPGPPPKPEPLPVVGVAASQQPVIEQPLIERPQT
jgi:hypothetical protein